MTVKKFNFSSKAYEEVEICEKKYVIDCSDDKIIEYMKVHKDAQEFYDKEKENFNKNVDDISIEEMRKLHTASLNNFAKPFINTVLNDENAFDELYEKAGKSVQVLLELQGFLYDIISEKSDELNALQKNKYING